MYITKSAKKVTNTFYSNLNMFFDCQIQWSYQRLVLSIYIQMA